MRYVLVTAAYNEERFIEQTIQSVIGQTVLPLRWVIVSDASIDRTDEIVDAYARQHEFIQLHRITKKHPRNFAAQVLAIRTGYEVLRDLDFEFIGNLDADVAMDSSYFETLLGHFRVEPGLGLSGGNICEEVDGEYRTRPSNNFKSVPHAVQMFRRTCFDAVGGYLPMKYGGPDWVAEVRARQLGWAVRSYPDLPVRHYRPTCAAEGKLRAWWRQGQMDYSVGSLFLFEVVKCARRVRGHPVFVGAAVRLLAYCVAYAKREPRQVSENFVRFLQREQRNRLLAMFGWRSNEVRLSNRGT
jgi:glycosyltransferase involved in cell wall biosynthesis